MVYDCIDTSYLEGITITWDSGTAIDTSYETSKVMEYDFASGALSYPMTVSNEPVCDSYTSSMLTFDTRLVDMNGVEYVFSTSEGEALYVDNTNNIIYFYLIDNTYAGLNTITITPVVTYSESLSLTYTDTLQFYYRLYACSTTLNTEPEDMLTSTVGMPNFDLTVNDASQTKNMWAGDSLDNIDVDICGKRTYALTVEIIDQSAEM